MMKMQFLVISLGIFCLSILISIIYSKALLQPIRMLIRATERIIDGNFDINIKNGRSDEIGSLINIFNRMILKIKHYMADIHLANEQLEKANIDLEHKVRERTKQLELLSNLDGLTGIANRRKMDNYLHHAWKVAIRDRHPLSLIILDIDCFKNYNDTYGHPAGDDCLKKIVKALSGSLKRSTDFAARYGGEEFVVVLSNTTQEAAAEIAENIRKAVEDLHIPHTTSLVSSSVTISLGLSTLVSFFDTSLPDFIKSADEALYAAKQSGKNCCVAVVYSV
jgi:diguanylate cyclase (GGDEF)-like protein